MPAAHIPHVSSGCYQYRQASLRISCWLLASMLILGDIGVKAARPGVSCQPVGPQRLTVALD